MPERVCTHNKILSRWFLKISYSAIAASSADLFRAVVFTLHGDADQHGERTCVLELYILY